MKPQPIPKLTSLTGTLTACFLVMLLFAFAVRALASGFENWTFEDVRRARAMQGRIEARPLQVRTSQGTQLALWTTPSDGASAILVNFIYTSCPTVCQTLGAEYTQMQRELADQNAIGGRVRLVSLSFDVEHDGTAQLDGYARLHHADPTIWTIAAPVSPAASERLLRELGVVVVRDGLGGYVHNASIHVTDGAGKVLAIYDEADWRDALALATRLTGPAR